MVFRENSGLRIISRESLEEFLGVILLLARVPLSTTSTRTMTDFSNDTQLSNTHFTI